MWKGIQTAFDGGVPNKKYKRCGMNYIIEMTLMDKEENTEIEGKLTKFKTNEARKVVDKRFAKYRANFLFVDRMYDIAKRKFILHLEHFWIPPDNTLPVFVDYIVGDFIVANGWTDDDDVICGKGIHYFNTLAAAFLYKELLQHQVLQMHPEMKEMTFNQDGALHLVCGWNTTTRQNLKLLEQKYNATNLIPSFLLCITRAKILAK